MKTVANLTSLLLMLLLVACGSDKDDPTPDAATFRVDIALDGDYEKFIKIYTLGGGDFVYRGTNEAMPAVLMDDNLKPGTLSFEAKEVRELNINTVTGFSAVQEGPATMKVTFTVFRNGKQLEAKSFEYNQASDNKIEFLNYKAK